MANSLEQRYFAGLSRNTFLLACASLFADISTEMLYPILPVFLTQTLNVGGSAVGLIDGVAQATLNIVQGFSGWLSDKLQRRKSIALVGYVLAAIAKPLIGLSTGWQGVLGARFVDRLGAGIRSAPRDALIASSADEEHRGKAFGLEGIGDNLGAFLGPLLAVFLLLFLHLDMRLIFYLGDHPGPPRRCHDHAGDGTTCGGDCKIQARREFMAISQGLLEISACDRIVRDRKLQQCISYPPDPRHRRFFGGDHTDLRCIQLGGGADLVSRWISFRQMGKKKHLAVVAHHVLCRLRWIRVDEECASDCGSVCLVWTVSRDIPLRWKSLGNGFRTGAPARQRSWLLQHHDRLARARGKHCCRATMGSCRPWRCISLWSGVRCCWQHCAAGVYSSKAKHARSGSSAEIVIRVCRRRLNSCRPVRLVKASADAASLAAIERERR